MSRTIIKNFRGLRALLLMHTSTGRDTLERTLGKLGLIVTVTGDLPDCRDIAARFDLVFFDADDGAHSALCNAQLPNVPMIALVGSEAPSHLARVVRFRAASHIPKPVRSSGVFTAILLAVNEHAARMAQEKEMQSMRRRLAGRRCVIEAVLALMKSRNVDEHTAYGWLRHEAMRLRIPLETMARQVLGKVVRSDRGSSQKTEQIGALNDTDDQPTEEK
ncbi:ANTAR domain-containing response regulator [Pontibaca salina]|uniref:ANTAR domain-containing protein n=1 Tax=Pontibaca salina TaxID=2795731 RepID=A0A934HV24_9RHOB|nr:ANTAR domain-containing protein [Pontibaca salina]MBI6630069.1 ANTAR domain-containing protein [Pontibaca salina]